MQRDSEPKRVFIYQDEDGKEPFTDWLHQLKDHRGRRIILRRLRQLESGHFGDSKSLGEGLHELRVHHGPGYRIYFGLAGDRLVVILSAGAKSSQDRDIERARAYWKEFKTHDEKL